MSKVVQLVAYQTNLVDRDDHLENFDEYGNPIRNDNPNTVVMALTEDGEIFITQNPQLDLESFDESCWKELAPPPDLI